MLPHLDSFQTASPTSNGGIQKPPVHAICDPFPSADELMHVPSDLNMEPLRRHVAENPRIFGT